MNLMERVFAFRNNTYKAFCASNDMNDPTLLTHFDESITRDKLWNIQPGDYILDVGAAFGSWTLAALSCGAAKVYAWSPQSFNGLTEKQVVEMGARSNGWGDKCVVYDTGVYSKSGWLNTRTQEFFDKEPTPHVDIIKIDLLDDWYENILDKTDKECMKKNTVWMKIDVESAELEVIKGAQKLINDLNPKIINENHTCIKPGIDKEFADLIKDLFAYKAVMTIPHHTISHTLFEKS